MGDAEWGCMDDSLRAGWVDGQKKRADELMADG